MHIVRKNKRPWELFKHPQLFRQQIILTDGSVTESWSLSDRKPVIKLVVDSQSHVSWNPLAQFDAARNRLYNVTKFTKDYAELGEFSSFLEGKAAVAQGKYSKIPIVNEETDAAEEPAWMQQRRMAQARAAEAAAAAEAKAAQDAAAKANLAALQAKKKPVRKINQ